MRRLLLDVRVRYGVVLAWAIYVLGSSVVTPPSGGLPPTGPLGIGADKWLHALSYATLTVLLSYALLARDAVAVAIAAFLAAAYGTGIEVVQVFLELRSFDIVDAAANTTGAALAAAGWWIGTYALALRQQTTAEPSADDG